MDWVLLIGIVVVLTGQGWLWVLLRQRLDELDRTIIAHRHTPSAAMTQHMAALKTVEARLHGHVDGLADRHELEMDAFATAIAQFKAVGEQLETLAPQAIAVAARLGMKTMGRTLLQKRVEAHQTANATAEAHDDSSRDGFQ